MALPSVQVHRERAESIEDSMGTAEHVSSECVCTHACMCKCLCAYVCEYLFVRMIALCEWL